MINLPDHNIEIGGKNIVFIFGPCVIESQKHLCFLAHSLKNLSIKLDFKFIFKASFDKANRTSVRSYRGPGLLKGLEMLGNIKKEFQVPILTDVHEVNQVNPVAEVADIIQIPAFLCRQTDLLLEASSTGRVINIKKGQFLAPWDMKNVTKKIEEGGNKNIILTERGTSFGYNNLVVDFTSFKIMKDLGYPVVFDATHSVQLPGSGGDFSGGRRSHVATLCKAAVAAGVDSVFLEVHENPKEAKSDSETSFFLSELEDLIKTLKSIAGFVR